MRKLVAVEAKGAAAVGGGSHSLKGRLPQSLQTWPPSWGETESMEATFIGTPAGAMAGIKETSATLHGRLEEEARLGERVAAGGGGCPWTP